MEDRGAPFHSLRTENRLPVYTQHQTRVSDDNGSILNCLVLARIVVHKLVDPCTDGKAIGRSK